MERDFLLKDLNEAQREAVSAPRGNMLIIAGAGTGKTRVLVSRIAWLTGIEQIAPRNILAMTFTNKAAAEMRDRVGAIMAGTDMRAMWVSTFHSACLRIMRQHVRRCGLSRDFTVIDTDGQKQLVKRIEQDLKISTTDFKPAQVASGISRLKEQGRRSDKISDIKYKDEFSLVVQKIYPVYELTCERENIVDFSEIILRTVETLRRDEELRGLLNRHFTEILVDEFQDTSPLQYELLELLRGPQGHVWAVGDDDQSIYGWRGADYRNMENFLKDFPDVHKVALTRNYRSGQYILDTANALIDNNSKRLVDKHLMSNTGKGERVTIVQQSNQTFEANYVVMSIKQLLNKGVSPSEIAILYRNNSLSQTIEGELASNGIRYTVYGGLKFFERAEINDAVAYLTVLFNPKNDTALLRIINTPSRKIGPKVITQLRSIARERKCPVYEALKLAVEYGSKKESPAALKTLARKVSGVFELIETVKSDIESFDSLHECVDFVINKTGLMDYYKLKDEKEGRGKLDNQRHENLGELVNIAANFEETHPDEAAKPMNEALLEFLSSVALAASTELTENGNGSSPEGAVNLMTIHASKGLEFRDVFVIGFENGILPSPYAEKQISQDEERRLAYVAITRARKHLWITFCSRRMVYGRTDPTGPSPFLHEIISSFSGIKPAKRPFEVLL